MNSDIFKRLLKKIEFEFEDGVVSGYFESQYYYIDFSFDFTSREDKIDFTCVYDENTTLTEEQKERLAKESHKIYKQHEDEYKQNLKEDRDFLGCNIIN